MLCGAWGSWGAVGAAGVCASTLAGWGGGVCAWGWAWGDVPQALSFSSRLLEGFPQASEDIRVVLGCGGVAQVGSLRMERISQHGFPCGLWHPSPRQLEAAVLRLPLAGPVDQALEGRLCPGPLSHFPELRVGPALPPLSMGGAVPLDGGLGVGVSAAVMGTGDGRARGSPRSPLPWGCVRSGGVGVRGSVGTPARFPLRDWVGIRGGGGSRACAGGGLTSGVGRGAGTLLLGPGAALVPSGAIRGPGVHRASAEARSAMKVVAAASVTVGGRRAGRCCCRVWDGWSRRS